MIKLYGRGQSRSFRALWALEEAGLDYEYVEVTQDIIDLEKASEGLIAQILKF